MNPLQQDLAALLRWYQRHPDGGPFLAGRPPAATRPPKTASAVIEWNGDRQVARYADRFDLIVHYVALEFSLDTDVILQTKKRCRVAEVAWARHIAMDLCRHFTGATIATIGAYFQVDHSVVTYAVQRVEETCSTYPIEEAHLTRMQRELKACLAEAATRPKPQPSVLNAQS